MIWKCLWARWVQLVHWLYQDKPAQRDASTHTAQPDNWERGRKGVSIVTNKRFCHLGEWWSLWVTQYLSVSIMLRNSVVLLFIATKMYRTEPTCRQYKIKNIMSMDVQDLVLVFWATVETWLPQLITSANCKLRKTQQLLLSGDYTPLRSEAQPIV